MSSFSPKASDSENYVVALHKKPRGKVRSTQPQLGEGTQYVHCGTDLSY